MRGSGGEAKTKDARKVARGVRTSSGKSDQPRMDERLMQMAKEIWDESIGLPDRQALMKKWESLGWACFAARQAAEKRAEDGALLYECLLEAAKVLTEEAQKINPHVGPHVK